MVHKSVRRTRSLTSGGREEVDDEVVVAAGEQLVRLLGQLVLVLVAEGLHVVLHLQQQYHRGGGGKGHPTRFFKGGCVGRRCPSAHKVATRVPYAKRHYLQIHTEHQIQLREARMSA